MSLDGLLVQYSQNFDRSTEAACRTPIDLVLNECLTELVSISALLIAVLTYLVGPLERHCERWYWPGTPSPYKNVKICCEVSFSHELSPKPTGEASTPIGDATTVNGRVDYGVGIVSFGPKVPNRRFYSLLIAVKAKPTDNLESAIPQLIVYLACLRQGRGARKRRDCSVYGVTSEAFPSAL